MLIKNIKAYVNCRFCETDILIKGKRISKIAKKINETEEVINGRGLIAFPGLIDIHTHMREPGQTHKEDFLSGSKSALAGGYSLIYDMPNNLPNPTITEKALKEKQALSKKALCEIRFHFGTTKTNFKEIEKAKPESLKIYMGKTTGNLLLDDENLILRHMKTFPHKKQILVHAQDNKIIKMLEKIGKQEEGIAEESGVAKAVLLAKIAKRKVHITHATSLNEIRTVKNWKLGSVGCTPHHLFLSKREKTTLKNFVCPPLRSKNEVALLWKNLEQIDSIETDHAPHLIEEIKQGALGFPGLETALALFLNAYSKKLVSLEWIATRFSENPAKIMGLQKYGKIAKGYFANITLVDLRKKWKVKGENLYSKAKWSPFEGKILKGKVVGTIYKGKFAFSSEHGFD